MDSSNEYQSTELENDARASPQRQDFNDASPCDDSPIRCSMSEMPLRGPLETTRPGDDRTVAATSHARAAMLASRMHSRRKKLLKLKRGMQRIQTQVSRKLPQSLPPEPLPMHSCVSRLCAGGRSLPNGRRHSVSNLARLRSPRLPPLTGIARGAVTPTNPQLPAFREVKLVSILKSPPEPGISVGRGRRRRRNRVGGLTKIKTKKTKKKVRFNEFVAIATPSSPIYEDSPDNVDDVPDFVRKMASLAAKVGEKLPRLIGPLRRSESEEDGETEDSGGREKSEETEGTEAETEIVRPCSEKQNRPPVAANKKKEQHHQKKREEELELDELPQRRKRSRSLPFLPRVDQMALQAKRNGASDRGGSPLTQHSSPRDGRASPILEEVMLRRCAAMYRCFSRVCGWLFRYQSIFLVYLWLTLAQVVLIVVDARFRYFPKNNFTLLMSYGDLSWTVFFSMLVALYYLCRQSCFAHLIPKLVRARQVRQSLKNYLHYSAMLGRTHSLTLSDEKRPSPPDGLERFTERRRRLRMERKMGKDGERKTQRRRRWRKARWKEREQWISGGSLSHEHPFVRRFSVSPTLPIPSRFADSFHCPPGDDGRILSPVGPQISLVSRPPPPQAFRRRFDQQQQGFQFRPAAGSEFVDVGDVVVVDGRGGVRGGRGGSGGADSSSLTGNPNTYPMSPKEMDREAMLDDLPERRTSTAESFLRVQRSDSLASMEFVKKNIRSLSVGHFAESDEGDDESGVLPLPPFSAEGLSSSSTSPDQQTITTATTTVPKHNIPMPGEYEQSPFVQQNRPFLRLLVDEQLAARVRCQECVHQSAKAVVDAFSPVPARDMCTDPQTDTNDPESGSGSDDDFPSLLSETRISRSPSPESDSSILSSTSSEPPDQMNAIVPTHAFQQIARSELVIAPLEDKCECFSAFRKMLLLLPQLVCLFLYVVGHCWSLLSAVAVFLLNPRRDLLLYVQNIMFMSVVCVMSILQVIVAIRSMIKLARRSERQEMLVIR